MKFIDSVKITVIAGYGGNGCISFKKNRKNNSIQKLNGSNGGDGGDIWLSIDSSINTLNYFRFNNVFKAQNGSKGYGNNCTGKKGKDLIIKVPKGTKVYCQETSQLLGDMVEDSNKNLMVAKGGSRGLGNSNFRYFSRNRDNKNFDWYGNNILGKKGESRNLLLELILLADVGVFGLPNSGKSSFLNAVSKAKPKIANYPFTTLTPNLGTVQFHDYNHQFVIADIPGIIRGASVGLGLGIKFLKHLERCRMLLHFVDIYPEDQSDPIDNILTVEQELQNYNSEAFINKTKWLIFNKIDLLQQSKLEKKINYIVQSISWKERYYAISVVNNINIMLLCDDIFKYFKDRIINNIR